VPELTCHVAIVSCDQIFRDHWIDALNECANQDTGSNACCAFRFIAVGTADDTLRDYVYSAKDAWHTPGYSGGDSLRDSPWVANFYQMMSIERFAQLSRCLEIATRLRAGINETGVFRVLELEDMLPAELDEDGIRLDPTKLSIDVSGSGLTARELQLALYEDYGVQVEKVTHNTLSVLVTLGATESKELRLLNAMKKLAAKSGPRNTSQRRSVSPLPALSEFKALPRDAYFGPTREISLLSDQHGLNREVLGSISADLVVPYPPGIPVLIPGQVINEDIANFLLGLHHSNNGTEIHGLVQRGDEACFRVVSRD
jgi:arginine decarboxylase